MEVEFTPDQKAFVRQAIESGRLQRQEDAVKEALGLWEERERRRLEILVAVVGQKLPWRAARAAESRVPRKRENSLKTSGAAVSRC